MFSGRGEVPNNGEVAPTVVEVADEIGRQAAQGGNEGRHASPVRGGAPGVVEAPTRPPLSVRIRFWFKTLRPRFATWRQNRRFRKAARLVRKYDGLVISNAAFQVALDRLANLSEWADNMNLSRRIYESHTAHVEDITRALALAAEIGDYTLQLQGRQERYVNLRYRAMTRRQRERLHYQSALEALERRRKQPTPPRQEVTPEGATV